jgi:hypothetical protein
MKREKLARFSLWLLIASASVFSIGCGDAASTTETGSDQPAAVSTGDLKTQFELIVESGYVGSGLPALQGSIESLNKPAVSKEFATLAAADAAGKQEKVRASARKIISQL